MIGIKDYQVIVQTNAFYKAIKSNHSEKAKKLLTIRNKQILNLREKNFLPIILIMQNDNVDVFHYLMTSKKINYTKPSVQEFKGSLLIYAIQNKAKNIFQWLVSTNDNLIPENEYKNAFFKALITDDGYYLQKLLQSHNDKLIKHITLELLSDFLEKDNYSVLNNVNILVEYVPIEEIKTYKSFFEALANRKCHLKQLINNILYKIHNIELYEEFKKNNNQLINNKRILI